MALDCEALGEVPPVVVAPLPVEGSEPCATVLPGPKTVVEDAAGAGFAALTLVVELPDDVVDPLVDV